MTGIANGMCIFLIIGKYVNNAHLQFWLWLFTVILPQMSKMAATALIIGAMALCCSFLAVHVPGNDTTVTYSFTGQPRTKAQLGEVLFFERKLSSDGSISCASCHIPAFAFADTAAVSVGVHGRLGTRNTPSCANMTDRPYFFYDGRAATLEEQVKFPIENKDEMGLPIAKAVKRLRSDSRYVQWFRKIYGSAPTVLALESAIASFEKTLETATTPFDRYMVSEDRTLLTAAALRGRELFMVKAKCFECHFTPDFTGDEFRNIGLFDGRQFNDSGRMLISRKPADLGSFKVPGLRNVAVTAPYMHNGMFATLREVIEYYDDPCKIITDPINRDTLLQQPLHLTAQEKDDLETFLHTLTDDRFVKARK